MRKTKPEKTVEAFNEKFKIGDDVLLKKDFEDDLFSTKIASEAQLMCGQPVVWLENVSGAYHTRCVFKVSKSKGGSSNG